MKHGTASGYNNHKCRCSPCTAANTESQSRYTRRKHYGVIDLVDVEAVRDHVAYLRKNGYGIGHISAISGVSASAITWIIGVGSDDRRRETKRLRQDNADAILAIKVGDTAPGFGKFLSVDVKTTKRRVRALLRVGYSRQDIAEAADLSVDVINKIVRPSTKTCGLLTREKIVRAYSKLDHHGPLPKTKAEWAAYDKRIQHATSKHWLAPDAWIDIDDLSERPNY